MNFRILILALEAVQASLAACIRVVVGPSRPTLQEF